MVLVGVVIVELRIEVGVRWRNHSRYEALGTRPITVGLFVNAEFATRAMIRARRSSREWRATSAPSAIEDNAGRLVELHNPAGETFEMRDSLLIVEPLWRIVA